MDKNYSIIIPFRNNLEQLVPALRSIPDRDDIQVVLVDNSEKSLEHEFINPLKKCRLDYKTSDPKKGAGCARNVGIDNAVGRWLLFLDSDDFYMSGAFDAFDKYIESKVDIIFFHTTSRLLGTEIPGKRHLIYEYIFRKYHKTKNDKYLRFRVITPYCKMIRRALVMSEKIRFQEVKVSNDVMFSIVSGYKAQEILCDDFVAYCVTEGPQGSSLTKQVTRENSLIRFLVNIECYKYLDKVGVKEARPSMLGNIIKAFKYFGPREALRYFSIARRERINVFVKLTTKNIMW